LREANYRRGPVPEVVDKQSGVPVNDEYEMIEVGKKSVQLAENIEGNCF